MRAALAIVTALSLTACNWLFDKGAPPPTPAPPTIGVVLIQPFAAGTDVDLSFPKATPGLRFVSDDPTVFIVGAQHLDEQGTSMVATGHALTDGTTTIRVVDDAVVYDTLSVTVKSVDAVRLFSQAAYRMGVANSELSLSTATALVGGKTAIGALLLHGEERLYSQTPLVTVDAPAGVDVEISATPISPAESLVITPSATGDVTLGVSVGTTAKASIALHVVDESAIASVTFAQHTKTETVVYGNGSSKNIDTQLVFATPKTASGQTVLGVYFDWTLNGVTVDTRDGSRASGDLFVYSPDPREPTRTLTATHGALNASLEVRERDGYVDDSTHLCSASGTPAESLMMLAFVLVALGVAHRSATRSRRSR